MMGVILAKSKWMAHHRQPVAIVVRIDSVLDDPPGAVRKPQ